MGKYVDYQTYNGKRVVCLTDKYQGVKKGREYNVYGVRGTLINIVSDWGHDKWLLASNFSLPEEVRGDGWTTP